MFKACGKEHLEIQNADKRAGDILHSFADIARAKEALDFVPRNPRETDIRNQTKESGIDRSILYERKILTKNSAIDRIHIRHNR